MGQGKRNPLRLALGYLGSDGARYVQQAEGIINLHAEEVQAVAFLLTRKCEA